MLHSQNLDLMTWHLSLWWLKGSVYTIIWSGIQLFGILWNRNIHHLIQWLRKKHQLPRARERCAQTFLGFTPLLVDGGMTVGGLGVILIESKTPITTTKMCLQFLSLSSGVKLWFNHEFIFCLMEITPISNVQFSKEENQEESMILSLPEENFCSLQWKCLD